MLRNFDCRYLPQIYSVDISDGKTVVTEEFISQKNLLTANLDEKQVIRAMVQLCAALDFIHGLGIVHRDIKPSNILLSEDGNICLIDFEAARFVRDDKDRDTRYLGTDGFAPPEQYGFSQTDFRTDIYAAG
ncbi:MAG: protein kinase, partial [Oscillospiraceae bacterium]|nr:protein kinase [Oscillospiraceae bacterium]